MRWLTRSLRILLRTAAYVWASPWTLLGLLAGSIGLATGGRVRRRGRVTEFYGGAIPWLLSWMPGGEFVSAMTLGHVILGRTDAALDACRAHEMVHVRQYERWGPLFVPAYVLVSLALWLAGKDAYRENPFERQAFDEVPEEPP